jgi:hypothetical protein
MTYYIAGPMRGYPNNNLEAFEAARNALVARGFDAVTPVDVCGSHAGDHVIERCLAADMEFIVQKGTEGIIVLPGWQRSKGTNAEVAAAIAVDKPVHEFAVFLLYGAEPPLALVGE